MNNEKYFQNILFEFETNAKLSWPKHYVPFLFVFFGRNWYQDIDVKCSRARDKFVSILMKLRLSTNHEQTAAIDCHRHYKTVRHRHTHENKKISARRASQGS